MFKPTVLAHPQAPILITKTFGGFAQGAVYDKETNQMVPLTGWFWLGNYKGWTIYDMNWQERIDKANEATAVKSGT
jgi:hypothetical protein